MSHAFSEETALDAPMGALYILQIMQISYTGIREVSMVQRPLQRSPGKKYIEAQAKIFKALGHPSRLLMAEALSHGPLCVCELQELVGADMSTVSRHLSVLKGADIVADEKRGQNVYYSLKLTCLGQFLNCTSASLDKQTQARQAQLAAMMAP